MSVPVAPLPVVATPRPTEGVVSWNVNTTCNYRCTYCTQRFKEDRGRWARDTPRFLRAFGRLSGRWEVKLSGGEPFVHPTLDEVVRGLAGLGHRIGVVTNFSAPAGAIERFVEAAAGRVSMFSCSFHPEYATDVDAFAAKAAWLGALLEARRDPAMPRPSVHVTCVATHAVLPRLPAIRARFEARGVTFKIQPEKQDRDVVAYTEEERTALLALGGHNLTGAVEHSFEGLPCWAGSRYFILDDVGRAYRCYPARRRRIEELGDFLSDAFRLEDGPTACLYRYCNCTVPIARGMMPRSPAVLEET